MDCPICFENILQSEITECGHHVHLECLEKQFKAECPLCRKKLNIKVTGKRPECNIEISQEELLSPRLENKEEMHLTDYLGDDRNSEGEVFYKDCSEDYDEENPHGDDWEYADVEFQ